MELEIRTTADPTSGGLIMQRNKVHHVYTVDRVARDLGVSEALIQELTLGLEPEDGVIWVYGANDDDGILAFTDEGIEEVELLLEEYLASPQRKLDPSTPVLRFSWLPDAHVCGLHRMRTPKRRLHSFIDQPVDVVVEGSRRQRSCRLSKMASITRQPHRRIPEVPFRTAESGNAIYQFS
ncbi:hypothetical protein [Mesorhizobium sp. M0195]|uniref:hypothetical protein n=1 Tax=Mesorhizobium sp. M0195 TaxID=2956910 RepID=UPI0033354A73